MVACTTTGSPRDSFIKRPKQTSTYYRYGPWNCYVSAPHWDHFMDWRSYQEKKDDQPQLFYFVVTFKHPKKLCISNHFASDVLIVHVLSTML